MKLMDWFNINEHTNTVSWKPFFTSIILWAGSVGMDCWDVADAVASILIKLFQLIVVVLGAYIAAHNAYAIHKKNRDERRGTGN